MFRKKEKPTPVRLHKQVEKTGKWEYFKEHIISIGIILGLILLIILFVLICCIIFPKTYGFFWY